MRRLQVMNCCRISKPPRRIFVAHTLAGILSGRSIAAVVLPVANRAVTTRVAMQQDLAIQVLGEVYGPCKQQDWKPKPLERTAPRYLWTDAFGVCAYVSLYNATKEERLLKQALALVGDVHSTLGHERPTSAAIGSSPPWLRTANEAHPTRGGLRIGKPHPEGHPDGDGQYFHYLTKWAFALNQVAAATGETRYLRWAVELMQTACRAFTFKTSSGVSRMCWKMSIDLSHPAVSSMGNLDPYDGLVTCTLLQQAAAAAAAAGESLDLDAAGGPDQGSGSRVLAAEIAELQAMVDARYTSYTSDDPLDLGEALWLSHWQLGPDNHHHHHQQQLSQQQPLQQPLQQQQQQQGSQHAHGKGSAWARHVSAVSLGSLEGLWAAGYFDQPLRWRLAFREFGTSIGLQALLAVRPDTPEADVWRQRVQQIHNTWGQHLYTRDRDITPVMYATSLVPGVWL